MTATAKASDISNIIDFPDVLTTQAGVSVQRKKWTGPRETVWCSSLMGEYDKWAGLVDLEPARLIELEKPIAPLEVRDSTSMRRSLGLPRIDAAIWHEDGSVSLLEAKVSSSPSEVCGGVGQLIYYKTLVEQWWGVKVAGLVLAAPFLPPYVLESIANIRAPIRFLKACDNEFNGLVARYQD